MTRAFKVNISAPSIIKDGGTSSQYLMADGSVKTGSTTESMNYAQTLGTKQTAISASGVTIVSVNITTGGNPVQVTVTGDAENSTAGGWIKLQLYRDSTAIGKIIHVESSAGSENIPYALNVIDSPAAGTYTYSLKTASTAAAGNFNFGETDGPVINAIELNTILPSVNLSLSGALTANSIIKSGGTSSQYLMADGSVTTGGGTTTNALTIGTGLSGTSFNGSSAVTIANTGVLSINGSTGAITNVAKTDSANTFTANQIITPSTSVTGLTINAAANSKGLIVKSNATGSGNIQEWQNSSATPLITLNSSGKMYTDGSVISAIDMYSEAGNNHISLGLPTDTWADKLRFRNGTYESSTDGSTSWTAGTFQREVIDGRNDSVVSLTTANKGHRWTWNAADISWSTIKFVRITTTYSSPSTTFDLLVQSSADGTTWTSRGTWTAQSSYMIKKLYAISDISGDPYIRVTITNNAMTAGIPLANIEALSIRPGDQGGSVSGVEENLPLSWNSSKTVTFQPIVASGSAIIAKGFVSQSGSIQEWQSSDGTSLAKISSAGAIYGFNGTYSTFFASSTNPTTGTYLGISTNTARMIGQSDVVTFQVRGASGQTASIQEWQNNANGILAKIDSSGNLTAASIIKTGGTSSQFLKADGSVDSSTYLTTGTASSTYLPLTGGTVSSDLTVTGNFTVNGTTTNLNSTNLVIEDKNIIIADVATPTDTTADGAGITIKGATDKTFTWIQSTGYLTSNVGIEATSFVKTSGTSSQFLKADGTVDSSTYLITTGSGTGLTGVALLASSNTFTLDQSINGLTIGKGPNSRAYNTAFGLGALFSQPAGIGNGHTAIGYNALYSSANAIGNTAVGWNALYKNTSGYDNTAIGDQALYSAVGGYNTGIGSYALGTASTSNLTFGTITGGSGYVDGTYTNVALTKISGTTPLYFPRTTIVVSGGSVISVTVTGTGNLAGIGMDTTTVFSANSSSLGGAVPTSVFSVPVTSVLTATNNTALGYFAGNAVYGGSGNVFLGYSAGSNENGSNKLYIANSNTDNPLIKGDFSAATLNINGALTATSVAKSGGTSSQFLMADGSTSSTTSLDIIPLDDISNEINGQNSRFLPKYQGQKITINNPLRLLVTINGIIQTVGFTDNTWQSFLPKDGFVVDNDGYIAFSEVPPLGSSFHGRLMAGSDTTSRTTTYPFRASDILLGE